MEHRAHSTAISDHSGLHMDIDLDMGKKCPMIMTFHAGHCETILWKGWVASTIVEFVLSALAIFVVAFLYEAIKFLRESLLRREARHEAERIALELRTKNNSSACVSGGGGGGGCSELPLDDFKEKTYWDRIFGSTHLIQTLLNMLQIIISYLMMLIFMTFNYWLCLAVVLGLGLGYFFFGWIKNDTQVGGECCP